MIGLPLAAAATVGTQFAVKLSAPGDTTVAFPGSGVSTTAAPTADDSVSILGSTNFVVALAAEPVDNAVNFDAAEALPDVAFEVPFRDGPLRRRCGHISRPSERDDAKRQTGW